MKGLLYYFSGTGNTKWAADRIKSRFEFYGGTLDVTNIEKLEETNNKGYEMIIFGTPVHAEVVPKIMMDFIDKLPQNNDSCKQCMLYCTLGAKSAAALDIMRRSLESKGYKVNVQAFIQLPNNYYFGAGVEPSEIRIKELFIKAEAKIKSIVDDFYRNNFQMQKVSIFRATLGKISGKMFFRMLPKLSKAFSSEVSCAKCGLCLRNCPKGNITFEEGKAVFHSNCIMCTRCIHICPINAIRYKGKKINQTQKHIMKVLDIR